MPTIQTTSDSLSQRCNIEQVTPASLTISDDLWRLDHNTNDCLQLTGQLMQQNFTVCFDFLDGALRYRANHGGGRKEGVAKAIGIKGDQVPSVIDATAGMGRESFLLWSLGCEVHSIERQPIIFALLEDAHRRLMNQLNTPQPSWKLSHANAVDYLQTAKHTEMADVIYLDPMYPSREKSAAVKKEMQVFKQLAGSDLDADELLLAAKQKARKRVVVKRPQSAPFLANQAPTHQIKMKKHRFDVYLT
ncbi:MAG: class I SAM-dependent methyltransferase [Gammaproteobacteria bacterium]|nr:class I SAM-dependent methyltransferase [Gammaproteobacteria bacterium]